MEEPQKRNKSINNMEKTFQTKPSLCPSFTVSVFTQLRAAGTFSLLVSLTSRRPDASCPERLPN